MERKRSVAESLNGPVIPVVALRPILADLPRLSFRECLALCMPNDALPFLRGVGSSDALSKSSSFIKIGKRMETVNSWRRVVQKRENDRGEPGGEAPSMVGDLSEEESLLAQIQPRSSAEFIRGTFRPHTNTVSTSTNNSYNQLIENHSHS